MKDRSNVLTFPDLRKKKTVRPPAGLGAPGRRLWNGIQEEYFIDDPAGLSHLLSAARAEDDIERLRKQIAEDGDMVTNRLGTRNANPLLKEMRGAEAVKRQALKELHLDLEPLKDRVGRPSGK